MIRQFLLFFLATLSTCSVAQNVYIDGFNYSINQETGNAVALGAPWQDDNLLVNGVLTIPAFVHYKDHDYYVTEIGDNAFEYWYAVNWVNLPNTITTIGKKAFQACVNVRFFAGTTPVLTTIKEGAFSRCYRLASFLLPPTLAELGNGAFEYCTNLTELNFSNTLLVDIPYNVCRGCKNLRSVTMFGGGTIPYLTGIRRINAYAFSGCDIHWISFPRSLLFIGNEAFKGCPIELVQCEFDDPFEISVDVFDVYETASLAVPKGTIDRFKKVSSWKLFWNIKEIENTGINSPHIDSIEENNIKSIYNIRGQKQNTFRKGINIIKSADGRFKKVISKN